MQWTGGVYARMAEVRNGITNAIVAGLIGVMQWTGGVYARMAEVRSETTTEKYTVESEGAMRTLLVARGYLYSIDVRRFHYGGKKSTIACGATRFGQHEIVAFLSYTTDCGVLLTLTEDRILNGTKMGSAFGYAVENADLNNDGLGDTWLSVRHSSNASILIAILEELPMFTTRRVMSEISLGDSKLDHVVETRMILTEWYNLDNLLLGLERMCLSLLKKCAMAVVHELSDSDIMEVRVDMAATSSAASEYPLSYCPICDEGLRDHMSLARRCDDRHSDVWLDEQCERSGTTFYKRSSYDGGKSYSLRCNRAGAYKKKTCTRATSSKKDVSSCSCFINVHAKEDHVEVQGCFGHIGHDVEPALVRLTHKQEQIF
ncbi:unnamed protein product [Cylicostephanus goldi]|uniref:Uncharacterized protein n=1 Tax=Cylicostephanus goldi TaxID=71465 RepID=A0A3P7Q1A4_CYLGO|nr:unnamed protein product [Cylicostephanus goldi]